MIDSQAERTEGAPKTPEEAYSSLVNKFIEPAENVAKKRLYGPKPTNQLPEISDEDVSVVFMRYAQNTQARVDHLNELIRTAKRSDPYYNLDKTIARTGGFVHDKNVYNGLGWLEAACRTFKVKYGKGSGMVGYLESKRRK